ncbi:MAG: transporter [Halorientalis sp.]
MAELRQQTDSLGGVLKRNALAGATVGAGAYVVGYLVAFVFTVIDGVDSSAFDIPGWKVVGWVFYNAHNVDIVGTGSVGGFSMSKQFSLLARASGNGADGLTSTVPAFLYFLVPAVVLIGAGYVAYQRAGERTVETGQAAALGATITIGYLVMAVLGRFLFTYSAGETVSTSATPQLTNAVLLAGLIYPLVLGAIGGAIAKTQGRESARSL